MNNNLRYVNVKLLHRDLVKSENEFNSFIEMLDFQENEALKGVSFKMLISRDVLTYIITSDIEQGDLIVCPWGKSTCVGIVANDIAESELQSNINYREFINKIENDYVDKFRKLTKQNN